MPTATKRTTKTTKTKAPRGPAAIAAGRSHLENGKSRGAAEPRSKTPAHSASPRETSPPGEGELVHLSPSAIVASQFNPRHDFPEETLKDLAASLKKHGVLQPVVVRAPLDGRHELIIGERRWRAAKLAKLPALPARVLDVTDEEAIELAGIENLQREDLNAIDEAHWYRTLLDRCGYTQESLAKHLSARGFRDIDQSTISKRVRLLDLPDTWQDRVRTGKLQPAAARELLPWLSTPKVLELLDRRLGTAEKSGYAIDTVRSFENEVRGAARDASKPMDSYIISFKPTKQQRQELDIRKVDGGQRAFNTTLYNQLQTAARQKQRKAAEASAPSAPTTKGTKGKAAAAPPEPSFDEERCYDLLTEFFEHTLAEHLEHMSPPLVFRLALLYLTNSDYGTIEAGVWSGQRNVSLAKKLLSATDDLLARDLRGWLKLQLESNGIYRGYMADPLQPSDWRDIAKYVGLDPLAGWEPTTEFLELFPFDDLLKLAGESPAYAELVPSIDELDKPSLIAWLIDHWPGGVPAPVRKVWES